MKRGRPRIPGLTVTSIRLRSRDITAARKAARERAIPYQHVIREWVAQAADRQRQALE